MDTENEDIKEKSTKMKVKPRINMLKQIIAFYQLSRGNVTAQAQALYLKRRY